MTRCLPSQWNDLYQESQGINQNHNYGVKLASKAERYHEAVNPSMERIHGCLCQVRADVWPIETCLSYLPVQVVFTWLVGCHWLLRLHFVPPSTLYSVQEMAGSSHVCKPVVGSAFLFLCGINLRLYTL